MFFDVARCKHGCGVAVIFKSHEGHIRRFLFKFTCNCTNNAIEYQAPCLGLYKAISMGIRCIIVHGDSELVINQVKDKISARHYYLNTYRNRILDLIESFMTINFISIPRKYNQIANALVGKGEHFNPSHHKRGSYEVKELCRPSVLDTANF